MICGMKIREGSVAVGCWILVCQSLIEGTQGRSRFWRERLGNSFLILMRWKEVDEITLSICSEERASDGIGTLGPLIFRK